jgi:hypothetical protein
MSALLRQRGAHAIACEPAWTTVRVFDKLLAPQVLFWQSGVCFFRELAMRENAVRFTCRMQMKLVRRLTVASIFACVLWQATVSSAENGQSSFGRLIEKAKGVVTRQPTSAPASVAKPGRDTEQASWSEPPKQSARTAARGQANLKGSAKSLASGPLKKKPRTVSEYMAQERP